MKRTIKVEVEIPHAVFPDDLPQIDAILEKQLLGLTGFYQVGEEKGAVAVRVVSIDIS